MDEGKQPLTEAEQKQMQIEQQIQSAEAQTGTTTIPRKMNTDEDPQHLDPRFDRDDLRQGKPPPAMKKHRHLRIRRKRNEKGKPLTSEERTKARASSKNTSSNTIPEPAQEDEADMTDEEVELTDNEDGFGEEEDTASKKPGLVDKLLGKS